ncbi:MAG TPA: hypothetical protein VG345_03375 [Bryobacteraceae bacterium]|nr:hypothetical protein [Bryobacteraceae bacterium]
MQHFVLLSSGSRPSHWEKAILLPRSVTLLKTPARRALWPGTVVFV